MKCLLKYDWVKLERSLLPQGKGLMGSWAKLASRAAFRKGESEYCGHINQVNAGEWSGGIVGVKSILGIKNRTEAIKTLDKLSELGYITYTLDKKTKKLTYIICDCQVLFANIFDNLLLLSTLFCRNIFQNLHCL